jgi:hypothetical protein
MLDHMLEGRFIFGISPGGLMSDAEAFGVLDADRGAMFLEAINTVLAIWEREPPYNIEGKYWKVKIDKQYMPEIGQGFLPRPLQRPHPPIVVTAAPHSKGVTEAAARGWDPISANFLMPEWVRHWPRVGGCQRAGLAGPANWASPEHLRCRRRQDRDNTPPIERPYRTTTASSSPSSNVAASNCSRRGSTSPTRRSRSTKSATS